MQLSIDKIVCRMELEELLVRYCYAVNNRDWTAYERIFIADATTDYAAFGATTF
jgi:hypothetical protein